MVEDDGRDARLRIHHVPVGQLDADLLGTEDAEQDLLVLQPGTGGISERVALPAVVRLEAVDHGHIERIREAPLAATFGVKKLRISLAAFDRERITAKALGELAVLLVVLGT